MVYVMRSLEIDSYNESANEARSAEKHRIAALKLTEFLENVAGKTYVVVVKTASCLDATKVQITIERHKLLVEHRGYAISAYTPNPLSLSVQLRAWLAAEMTHVTKVLPKV